MKISAKNKKEFRNAKITKIAFLTITFIFAMLFSTYADETNNYIDGQIVVKFNTGVSETHIENMIDEYDLTALDVIPKLRYYVFNLSERHSVEEAVSLIKGLDIVSECEPNYVSEIQDLPNDDLVSNQWSLDSNNTNAHLYMKEAWELEKGNTDVVVAIIEVGFDTTHEDLQENIWQNPNEIPENGIDDDDNGYIDDMIGWDFVHRPYEKSNCDIKDEDNDPTEAVSTHGNRVLGVLGATMNNGIGITGIAGDCKMMLIRAGYVNNKGKAVLGVSFIIKGILYAVDNGAKVINISSGGSKSSKSYKAALSYAIDNGAVIICSAGNDGTSFPHYPAAYDLAGLISVGATTEDDEACWFSSYGTWVDVSAPGQKILSTLFDNRYGLTQGTSFSAPMVAGVAALLVSRYPDWTPAQIQDRIMNTVDISDSLEGSNITSGRVNAYRALYDVELDGQMNNSSLNSNFKSAEGSETTSLSDNSDDSAGNSCFISTISF